MADEREMNADDTNREAGKRWPVRGCGKTCYPGEGAARRAIRTMQDYGRGHGYEGRLHPYFCKPCRAFHVGHR